MEIWERQRDTDGKLEPIKAFEYFITYMLMDKPRSLRKLANDDGTKTAQRRQLERYSKKWNWVARCEAYDEYILQRKINIKERFVEGIIESELPALKRRLEIFNNNIDDIDADVKTKNTSKAHAYEKNSKAHSSAMNEIMLLTGNPTEINQTGLNVKKEEDTLPLEDIFDKVDHALGLKDEE